MKEPKFKVGDEVIWNSRPNQIIRIVDVKFNNNNWEYWNDCFGTKRGDLSYFHHDYAIETVRKVTKLDKALK